MLAEPVLPVTVFIIEVAEQEQRRLMPLFPADEYHVVTLSSAHLDNVLPNEVPDVLGVQQEQRGHPPMIGGGQAGHDGPACHRAV